MAEEQKETRTDNEALLKEIRERYDYALGAWAEIREAARKDNKLASGDAWDDDAKLARKGRPCLNFDEVNQHLNQLGNGFRQNKRGIKVSPVGSGADDDNSELKESIIRRIENRSNALAARSTAFDAEIRGGYGFTKIVTRYIDNHGFDQEILIGPVRNPDSVLIDPDYQQPDASDIQYAFELEPMQRKEFKRRFKKATVTDFSAEHLTIAPRWSQENTVLVAGYWRVESTYRTLKGEGREREVDERRIVRYLTNGLEILDTIPWGGEITKKDGTKEWRGKWIPIVAWLGKEVFIDQGAGAKRHLYSLIRLTHDPQKLTNLYRSNELEEAQMTPKAPVIGYKGQFESDKKGWSEITTVPRAYLEVDAITDPTGQQILPLPQRQPFQPNFAAYEIAAESSRRAVQAAMGISPLPTAAQRRNEKSGKALERIEASAQQGSYHFNDNADRAIAQEGRIILDLMPVIYDTAREVGIQKPDDTFDIAKVNQDVPDQSGEDIEAMLSEGDQDVTVSTGPSYESQHEEAKEFVNLVVSNIPTLPLPPEMTAKLLALAFRFQKLGPIVDKMADILSPEEKQEMPPQAMQAIQQLQQEKQALDAFGKEQQERADSLQAEKVAKLLELDSKERVAAMNNQTQLVLQQMQVSGDALIERLSAEFTALSSRLTAQQEEAQPVDEFAEAGQ